MRIRNMMGEEWKLRNIGDTNTSKRAIKRSRETGTKKETGRNKQNTQEGRQDED